MHDLNYFRDHLDLFAEMAKKRGVALHLEGFRARDKERRELITEAEALRARRNEASEEIGRLKKENRDADAIIAQIKTLAEPSKEKSLQAVELTRKQEEFLLTGPNFPQSSVPVGHSAAENVEIRRWGTPPKFDSQPKPHW